MRWCVSLAKNWLQKAPVFWIFATNLELNCTEYARSSQIHVLGNTMCVILSESTRVINGWMSSPIISSTHCERSEQCPHPPNVVPQDVPDRPLAHESNVVATSPPTWHHLPHSSSKPEARRLTRAGSASSSVSMVCNCWRQPPRRHRRGTSNGAHNRCNISKYRRQSVSTSCVRNV